MENGTASLSFIWISAVLFFFLYEWTMATIIPDGWTKNKKYKIKRETAAGWRTRERETIATMCWIHASMRFTFSFVSSWHNPSSRREYTQERNKRSSVQHPHWLHIAMTIWHDSISHLFANGCDTVYVWPTPAWFVDERICIMDMSSNQKNPIIPHCCSQHRVSPCPAYVGLYDSIFRLFFSGKRKYPRGWRTAGWPTHAI